MTIDHNFQTPDNVIEYMISMIPEGANRILEPSPGLGKIVEKLKQRNYSVTAAEDFFLLEKSRFDCVIMNPPFSSKSAHIVNAPEGTDISGMKVGYYFLTQCMEMSDNVIALMPWFTIADSDVRLRYLKKYGIVSLTALPRKTFQYARIQTCIIELRKGFTGETIFKTLQ